MAAARRAREAEASFADQLRAQTAASGGTKLSKVIEKIKRDCFEASAKGHSKKSYVFLDFVGDLEAVRIELELMGLCVASLEMSGTSLCYEVSWSDERPTKRQRIATGNVQFDCGVCSTMGPVQRLHPCGHLLGSCCLKVAVGKKCPFCREEVRISQPIFNP